MITLADSLQLAYTKIRTRRIRLFVVLFVSSLLFAGLIGGSVIVTGALSSFKRFSDEGFSNRFILAGRYSDSELLSSGPQSDPAVVARIEALEKQLIADKTAEAKRLGITYSKDQEQSAIESHDGNKYINYSSRIAAQAMAEATDPKSVFEKFKLQTADAEQHYRSVRMPMSAADMATLSSIKDDKENLSSETGGYDYGSTSGVAGVNRGWMLMDKELLGPFLLPGQSLDRGKDGSVPIVATYSAAQEVLSLPKMAPNATSQQKKERLESVRSSIAGKTFQICYRNVTSHSDVQAAVQQQADIAKNKSKKGYETPDLVYKPSDVPCQAPVVQRDVRTSSEKILAAKQAGFDKQFGKADAVSQLITFRIVGLSQDHSPSLGGGVTDLFTSMLVSSLGVGWVSPIDTYDSLPVVQDVFKADYSNPYDPQEVYYAEYASAQQARDAYKNKNCVVAFPGMPIDDNAVKCTKEGRSFSLMPFGSISLALDEFQQGFRKVQLGVAAVTAAIASLILMGMIGRIVADSRRETAVFRAVGASRVAIAQIYVTYTLYLAILTIFIASLIGFGLAIWVNNSFAAELGITMALIFNVSDLSMPFRLYGISTYDIALIAAVIVGASLIGSIFPIAHNVRRNPIKDMREE